MSWTIYCHMHIESGRRYIGQTKYSMMHRWNQHCAQAKKFEGKKHSEETKAKIAAAVRAKREARTAAEAERAIEYPIAEDS